MARRAKVPGSRRAQLLAGVAALLVLGLIGGLVVWLAPGIERAKRTNAAAVARHTASVAAAARRQLAAEQAPHSALVTVSAGGRQAVVGALERAIASDARARIAAGKMTGPLLRVVCSPFPKGSPAPTGRIGDYSCLAVTSEIKSATGGVAGTFGNPFWARVDFARGRLAWCEINPQPGEQATGMALASVPLAPVCDLTHSAPPGF